MAIAAMISMIATTIRSSISENPPCAPVTACEVCFDLNIFSTARIPYKKEGRKRCFLPSQGLKRHYCSGGLPEPEHGFRSSPTVPAESTRTTPDSSMQYAAVPVESETGAAVTEKPVSPEPPQAAGMPAVRAAIPLLANVNT